MRIVSSFASSYQNLCPPRIFQGLYDGGRVDMVNVLPSVVSNVDMRVENPGRYVGDSGWVPGGMSVIVAGSRAVCR